jgi:hypothetical protein
MQFVLRDIAYPWKKIVLDAQPDGSYTTSMKTAISLPATELIIRLRPKSLGECTQVGTWNTRHVPAGPYAGVLQGDKPPDPVYILYFLS